MTEREKRYIIALLTMQKHAYETAEKIAAVFGGDTRIENELVRDAFVYKTLEIAVSYTAVEIISDYYYDKISDDQLLRGIEYLMVGDEIAAYKAVYGDE
ncbi:hypothetical protein [Neobacillus mesonae]|uniref:Uncharacterized protein n=1 Tax=Neobacillus mesonae TaxID=1193713 RepID=A0A3T0HVF1_9BACI|nr:hypothetical protein [Neobacillus mesonae]AZU61056.1 hypothetical protein CHR53_07200 [Neobacillus mesonae]